MSAAITLQNDNQLCVSGELKFPMITALREETEALLGQMQDSAVLDFSAVAAVDSSALSFWMCCQRFAAKRSLKLQAQDVPEEMLQFATLVGLEQAFSDN